VHALDSKTFLKIAKINSQQEKPVSPNRKTLNSRKNLVLHGMFSSAVAM